MVAALHALVLLALVQAPPPVLALLYWVESSPPPVASANRPGRWLLRCHDAGAVMQQIDTAATAAAAR